MLNDSSKSDDGFKGINNLKEIKAILKAIKNDIYNDNLALILVTIRKNMNRIYR